MARQKPSKRYGQIAENILGIKSRQGALIPPEYVESKKRIKEILPKIEAAKAKNAELQRKRAKN